MTNALTPTHPAGGAIVPAGQLRAEHADDVRRLYSKTKSENTMRAYRRWYATYCEFCASNGYAVGDAASVAAFVSHLTYKTELSAASVRQALAGVRWFCISEDGGDVTKAGVVVKAVTGAAVELAESGRAVTSHKHTLTLDELARIVDAMPADLRGLRDRAMILMGFWGAFRRSELAAMKVDQLRSEGDGVAVVLPRSKANQAGKREEVKHFPPDDEQPALCPVRALRAWLVAARIKSGPVFRGVDMFTGILSDSGIERGEVARIIKRRARAAGIDAATVANLGGHSLRRGFVTAADAAGASDSDTAQQTGQTLHTLQRYKDANGIGARRAVAAIRTAGMRNR